MDQWPHILVVDDDQEILSLLGRYLATQEFRVTLASDGLLLNQLLVQEDIDLIVLDVMIPGKSGLTICQELRARSNYVPVILLTALKEDVDRIIGLEIGADDYVSKPFNPRELVARIRAVLRRNGSSSRPKYGLRYRFGQFLLEATCRELRTVGGEHVDLTAAEFDLLYALVIRPGRILSREQLLEVTQGRGNESVDRSVDVLMSRVRRKLGDEGFRNIRTVRNGGYQLVVDVVTLGAEE
jgi:two-component system OmpR family response regulator